MRTPALRRHGLALAAASLLAAALGPAAAHDTWFQPLPPNARGALVLALGTGNQYPVQETPVALRQLHSSGCVGKGLPAAPLRWVADEPTALVLRTALPAPVGSAISCWAQLVPIDIQIDDATVDLYLDEVRALPAVRERWAALKARGVPWRETYVKHVRLELPGTGAREEGPTEAIDGLGLDVRLDSPRPLRAGDTLRVQLLRDGQPLAGQPLQLVGDGSGVGVWRRTDAQGRLELRLPAAGRWLLRGTELRPAPDGSDRWDSRFVTLAFEVKPPR
jgi:hypothetical protein